MRECIARGLRLQDADGGAGFACREKGSFLVCQKEEKQHELQNQPFRSVWKGCEEHQR